MRIYFDRVYSPITIHDADGNYLAKIETTYFGGNRRCPHCSELIGSAASSGYSLTIRGRLWSKGELAHKGESGLPSTGFKRLIEAKNKAREIFDAM